MEEFQTFVDSDIAAVNEEIQALRNEINNRMARSATLRKRKDGLQDDYTQYAGKPELTPAEKANKEYYETQILTVDLQLLESQKTIDELQKKIDELQKKIDQLQLKKSLLEIETQKKIDELQLKNSLLEIESQKKIYGAKLMEIMNKSEEQRDALESQKTIDELQKKIDELQKKIDQLQLKKSLLEIESQKKIYEAKLMAIMNKSEEQRDALEKRFIEDYEKKMIQFDMEIIQVRCKIISLNDRSNWTIAERHYMDNCKAELDRLSQQLIALNKNVDNNNNMPIEMTDRQLQSQLKRAFNDKYQDNNLVEYFKNYCMAFSKSWISKKNFFSPYITILQSSGTGKSRLLFELAKQENVLLFYICFRPEGSSGYPPRSSIASQFLKYKNADEVSRFYETCFSYARSVILNENHDIYKIFVEDQFEVTEKGSNSSFWEKVMNTGDVSKLPSDKTNYQIIICHDEARQLISSDSHDSRSLFRVIRKGATRFNDTESHGLPLLIFVDTSSRLSNFNPSLDNDPSARDSLTSNQLMTPFWFLNTWNITMNGVDQVSFIQKVDELCVRNNGDVTPFLREHFKRGRPLWTSYCETGPLIDVIKLAQKKLTCNQDTSPDAIIALLNCRVPFAVYPATQLATNLVANHAAMCLAISPSRESIITSYPSEPVLSEAAASKLSDISIRLRALHTLHDYLQFNIDRGHRGEIIGCLISLFAFDRAVEELNRKFQLQSIYSRPIDVQDFLFTLFGVELEHVLSKVDVEGHLVSQLKQGSVFFTHYVKLNNYPSVEDLATYFYAGAAILCKDQHPGIDRIIPVRLKDGNFSAIIFQDRNKKHDSAVEDASNHVCFINARLGNPKHPYLAIYANYRIEENYVRDIKKSRRLTRRSPTNAENTYQIIIGAFGLKCYRFLADDEINYLQKIVTICSEDEFYIYDDPSMTIPNFSMNGSEFVTITRTIWNPTVTSMDVSE